jgi:SAM-dependent methyltransferase
VSAWRRRFPVEKPAAYGYDAAYRGVPNWDVGRPQSAFVALEEAGLVRGPVLDVGCGTGELSLYLARQGHDVLGIDIAPTAVARAREKARWRRIPAAFLVWDAMDLAGLADRGLRFRTVVDSATFHIFGDRDRDRYVEGLKAVLEPGGAFLLLGDARPEANRIYGVSPGELRARFRAADGWEVGFVRETVFERRYSTNPAYVAALIRR